MGGLGDAALWALCAFSAVLALISAGYALLMRRRIRRLSEQIEDFLTGHGAPLSFSVQEDALSPLHNAGAELEERLLLAKEHEAGERTRAKTLTADISHQLKTPLSTLKLYCEMDAGAHLSGEMAQIERMERLIYSLLRLERLCADGYDFDMAMHEVNEIIEDAYRPLEELWPDCRLELTGSACIRCDKKWLGEALGNLLKNACEHMPSGGVIRAHIEQSEAAVTITVEDEGGGVSREELPHLFERFYRTRAGQAGGAGLGLAIAHEVAARHHGSIRAENAARGLRMTVTLPVF